MSENLTSYKERIAPDLRKDPRIRRGDISAISRLVHARGISTAPYSALLGYRTMDRAGSGPGNWRHFDAIRTIAEEYLQAKEMGCTSEPAAQEAQAIPDMDLVQHLKKGDQMRIAETVGVDPTYVKHILRTRPNAKSAKAQKVREVAREIIAHRAQLRGGTSVASPADDSTAAQQGNELEAIKDELAQLRQRNAALELNNANTDKDLERLRESAVVLGKELDAAQAELAAWEDRARAHRATRRSLSELRSKVVQLQDVQIRQQEALGRQAEAIERLELQLAEAKSEANNLRTQLHIQQVLNGRLQGIVSVVREATKLAEA